MMASDTVKLSFSFPNDYFEHLINSQSFADVKLCCCDGKRFWAHKLILSAASSYFYDILLKHPESYPVTVILTEIKSDDIAAILSLLYTGIISLPKFRLQQFLKTADTLKIPIPSLSPYISSPHPIIWNLTSSKDQNGYSKDSFKENHFERKSIIYNPVLHSPWSQINKPTHKPVIQQQILHFEKNNLEHYLNNNILFENKNYSAVVSSIRERLIKEDPVVSMELNNRNEAKETIIKMEMLSASTINNNPVEDNDNNNNNKKSKSISTPNSSVNENKKVFSCHVCGKTFSQQRNYKYHESLHEKTGKFKGTCSECGKEFSDRGYLTNHKKIHRNRKEYICQNCGKSFNQKAALNMHAKIHSGLKPHQCNQCIKSFSRKILLKQHLRTHSGERPYQCNICQKTFADRSNMIFHTKLHSGIKPFECHICSKTFTKKHHLTTHINFHNGFKPYKCPKCSTAFSQSSNMKTHFKKCQKFQTKL